MYFDNIKPVYFLKKWKYYEVARQELNKNELQQAKIFFNALKKLSDADRGILADIYYYSNKSCSFDITTGFYRSLVPFKDKELNEQYGVNVDRFRKMRLVAQQKLKDAMQEMLERISDEFVFRMSEKLYLVGLLNEGTYQEQYILGDVVDALKIGVTDGNEEKLMKLLLLGFEKVPVYEREI